MILAALSSCAVARHTLQSLPLPLPKGLLSLPLFRVLSWVQGIVIHLLWALSAALVFPLLIFNVCHSKARINLRSSWKAGSQGLELVLATPDRGGFIDMDTS